jgi:DNA-binding PadR family transcriptional regulator
MNHKLKLALIYTEHRNTSRELFEQKKLSELDLEILCIVYSKGEQGYIINPADIFNLTNYRYSGEIYKKIKVLCDNGYLMFKQEKRPKRDKKFYTITVKGINAIQKIIEAET